MVPPSILHKDYTIRNASITPILHNDVTVLGLHFYILFQSELDILQITFVCFPFEARYQNLVLSTLCPVIEQDNLTSVVLSMVGQMV